MDCVGFMSNSVGRDVKLSFRAALNQTLDELLPVGQAQLLGLVKDPPYFRLK